ncbi:MULTISPECIES: ArsR/SmtB family transcription factor [unclassified Rhodococcus (in: high G+C Gram-positive bacteria)]|uniref:ArsR/SmtB family transcription factor n=1 Tax=unclassified Rhodococcus (in: high G+C Gram-positive bacteria) TaxID=192944 RepID=UPI00070164FF|nr:MULTISPECIES: winged helix-turn-helix domain-containing protein [unclassified Rhodococcus (in: high G+C Gram-positive bacteria)]KQU29391.1 MarR family transcriptional regulator [Rhodococcus sp. Leaf225]KQU41146.1 MarR family transcriptional regulator [Rhodococcus sp. Leaf258]
MSAAPRPVSSVSQLKALTHPLRVRILYAVQAEGAATASRIGQLVDESPASVSYHLRKLADAGFVQEAPDRGTDGRERWWRVPDGGFTWSSSDFDATPEGRTTDRAARRLLVDNQFRRRQEFDSDPDRWGTDWVQGAFSTDYVLRMTAEQLEGMSREIQSVIEKWRARAESAAVPVDSSHVMVFAHGFPFEP